MIERIEPGKTMSRAVIHNGLIYFGGHVSGGKQPTMKEQATALLARYDELLQQYGSDKSHILSAEIYVTDMKLKSEFNEVWDKWIPEGCAPRRVCVEVGLDEGYLVEVTITPSLLNNTCFFHGKLKEDILYDR